MKFVLLDDQGTGKQMVFQSPLHVITAARREELPAAFAAIETAQKEGKWLAGRMSYELGLALEPRFKSQSTPLLHLGVFEAPSDHPPANWLYTRDIPTLDFKPSWTEETYLSRFDRVQKYLTAGDCYQVNLTFPMHAKSTANATQIYAAFRQRQPGRYGAIVSLGGPDIVSFSPELFFERKGQDMRMRPMKGTRPRKADAEEDAAIRAEMLAEPKSQAENLMIVDLLRNDLSRLCEPGSVKVPELFTLETYPTLHQMTSQVTGRLKQDVSWFDIFRGLFPCGSITGAPKVRTMEIINELEDQSRNAYCGTVGYIAPNGDASFSVAIRTVQMQDGQLRYDVGSGVVLDSDGPDEYKECLLKSQIFAPQPEHPIETFLRRKDGTIPYQSFHEKRLSGSSNHSPEVIHRTFETLKESALQEDLRVRIEATETDLKTTAAPYQPFAAPLTIALSRYCLESNIQNTASKSTRRDFYDGERARLSALSDLDEVVFLNPENEVCEGSFTSVFVEKNGLLYTPALACGLLPGVLRQAMLAAGEVTEAVLGVEDLKNADAIFVGNSLRGLIPAKFRDFDRH